MKKFIIILVISILGLTYSSYAQRRIPKISQAKRDSIVALLDSQSILDIYRAISAVDTYQITEALPKLERDIFKYNCILIDSYLNLLNDFSSSNLHYYVMAAIDSSYKCEDRGYSCREQLRYTAASILINKFNDYSKASFVIEKFRVDFNHNDESLLTKIFKNAPQYADSARYYLFKIASLDNPSGDSRFFALNEITELFPGEAQQIALNMFKYDRDNANRISAFQRLCKLNYPQLNQLIRERLSLEPAWSYRIAIADTLLKRFGNPADIKFLREYLITEPDSIAISLVSWFIKRELPKTPTITTSLQTMLDTLTSYTNQSYNYNWLREQSFRDQLLQKIQSAKNYLSLGDSVNCVKETKSLQTSVQQIYADSTGSYPNYVNKDAWKFLYYYSRYILERLPSLPTVKLINSAGTKLTGGILQFYEGSWKDAMNNNDGTFAVPTKLKTVSLRMNYAYGSQTKSNVAVGADSVVFQTVNTIVQLKNSLGNLIDDGTVQYYSGAWRDFGVTTNGVTTKELLPNNYSFRMSYAFASNDKAQDITNNYTIVFQTVNAAVQLKNSLGNFIDQGTVQYYSGAWRDFGVTTSGVVTKELLPNNYSFRMNYAFASNDKQQNIGTDPMVVFQTVNTAVQLKNSLGNFIDAGTVQYYSGAWRDFGVTASGVVTKELLPNNYSFRMSYAFASNDKQQNIGIDATVVFQTVNAAVQLKNGLGNLIDAGIVQYYSDAWRDFGVTTIGVVTKELLPNNYSFRMNYAFASNDKQQNIGTDPIVVFQTVNATVQLKNSLGNLIDAGTVQYYSGAWRSFGVTTNGVASLELLSNNYSFRMMHEFVSNDKAQNIGTNNIVEFRTTLCRVNVTDAQNQPINNAIVSYYSGAWRSLGATLNGIAAKELLPANLTFRAISGSKQADKTQNILTNNIVEIKLP